MRKHIIALAFVALCAASCGQKGDKTDPKEQVVTVKEMTIGLGTVAADYSYSGTVEEEAGRALSFTVGGTITSLRVSVGDHVQKGQLIATVDESRLQNNYAMAHATLSQAEDAYARMKQLHDRGTLTEIKWVEAESRLAQARAAEEIAKKNLADCHLYAPCAGVVSEKLAEQGQNTGPGTPIVRIVTTSVLNVAVSVPEGEISSISEGQTADVVVPALKNRHYNARVVEKAVQADAISRTYVMKLRLDQTGGGLLPGMVTKVAMRMSQTDEAIVIPARLLQLADNNDTFVWVDEGGKAVRRIVTLGDYTPSGVTITSGLQAGDKIIVEGQQKLSSGMRLKVI